MKGLGKYEILYDLPEGEYAAGEVGGIRTRTIRAGDSLEVECFPITRISHEAERERLRRRSSPAQEALNRRRSADRMRRLAEANFGEGDWALHLTINYGIYDLSQVKASEVWDRCEKLGLPTDEAGARRVIRAYIKRVKRAMAKKGRDARELKYLYVMESTAEPRDSDPHPLPMRFHFHGIFHAPGMTREELEALWGLGYANCDRLDLRDNGLSKLAQYLTKQRKFTRRWAHSKNLVPPKETVSDRKVSRRRAALVARDVQTFGAEIFEAIYPGYQVTQPIRVVYSDFVAGAYIYARLRRVRS